MVENDIKSIFPPNIFENPQCPIFTQDSISEGNLGYITPTILIDISEKPSTMEHIHLGKTCSPKEIIAYTTFFKEL